MVVEALTARILPGSPEDPGAREAGVVFYIDRMLSGNNDGLSVMTYSQGPFMEVTEVEATVESTSRTDIYETIQVAPELASRYGYQSALTPQEIYRRGVLSVIAHVDAVYGVPFENLTEAQHDEIVEAMFADEAEGFDAPSGRAFFTKLRNDTIEGMFSDPMYGGNREMVGWRLIGYPGVRGHYSHSDMLDPAFHAEPVSLADMAEHGH